MTDPNQKILKELSKSFSEFSIYLLLNDTRSKMIGTIIKNELGKLPGHTEENHYISQAV